MTALARAENDLETIADELVACRADPFCFVETMFDWHGPELKGKAIEAWQREVLCAIRDGLPLTKQFALPSRQVTEWARPVWLAGSFFGLWRL
jgi:hypothetical protein